MQSNTATPVNSIRLPQVRKICGNVSASTVWNWVKNSDKTGFPRPYKLSDNCTVWDAAEIAAFIQARIAASRDQSTVKAEGGKHAS